MHAVLTVYNGCLVLESYLLDGNAIEAPRHNLSVSREALNWMLDANAKTPPEGWEGDGLVEWTQEVFRWPGGDQFKVWRSLDAFVLKPESGITGAWCSSANNDTSEEAKKMVDDVRVEEKGIAGYIVTYAAFDYNDEYYTEERGYTIGFHLYSTKGDAEKVAREANRNHVLEVLEDIGSWTYGEGLSSQIREDASADELRRFAFILGMPLPEDKSMEEVEEYIDSAREVKAELTEEDLDFLLDMWPGLSCAHVAPLYKA